MQNQFSQSNGGGADTPASATSTQPYGMEETQETVYARNKAIFEASLQPTQQQQQQQMFGMASQQQQPQSFDASNGSASAQQQPVRKKLIRAGDMESRNGSQSPAPFQQQPGGNGAMAPYAAQPSYSPPPPQTPASAAGHASGGMSELDTLIENQAQAFVEKNPSIAKDLVRSALKHSRGQFDSNFHQAITLLLSQKAGIQAQAQTQGQAQAQMSRHPMQQQQQLHQQQYQMQQQQQMPQQQVTGNYPGFVQAQPQMYANQASVAQNINNQSSSALAGQQQQQQLGYLAGPSASPAPPAAQALLPAPPPKLIGSHPTVGFSALQVLPKEQHAQFLQLAPSQQTEYSLRVYQSLPPPQQAEFTNQFRAAEQAREQYYAQQYQLQMQQMRQSPQMQHSAFPSAPAQPSQPNRYLGYAGVAPSTQHQSQQQRFPGQNPVFRVGAPVKNGGPSPHQGHSSLPGQGQGQMHIPPPGGAGPMESYMAQQRYLQEQQQMLLEQMGPQQRQAFYQLDPHQQTAWIQKHLVQQQEQKRREAQANPYRQKQQEMMAQTHKAAKDAKQKGSKPAKGSSTPAAAAAAGSSQPGTKKKKRKGHSDSDDSEALGLHDEDSGNDDDDDDGDGDEMDASEDEEEREAHALVWFNECKAEELMEMTACKQEVADAVIEMRPYESPSDARGKLRKRKGVPGVLFDNYVDLMHSYAQTDTCLARCQGIGKELLDIMTIWTGGKKIDPTPSMRPSAEPEDAAVKTERVDIKPEAAEDDKAAVVKLDGDDQKPAVNLASGDLLTVPSVPGVPDVKPVTSSEGDADTKHIITAEATTSMGTNLVAMSEDLLKQSTQQDASAEVKEAFKDYLYAQPALLKEGIKLKNYQLLGVNWLNLLYRKNISCILADEMGLGKTAQVIALIAHLKETNQPGPHLVIVPSSTLDNWIREFDVFAPALKVFAYYGTQPERADARYFFKQEPDLDVIVTTYNMATGHADDKKFLKKMDFKACVFDEGHQLKNAESKKYKDLMEIKVEWRLLLTGTPLQNNLQELVSLLSFILPGIFSEAQESLRAIFKVPAEAQKNLLTRQRVRAAKQVMTPFVLRRKKAQVLQDLPPKTEIVVYCDMTPAQRDIYRETLAKHKKLVVEYAPSGSTTPAAQPEPTKKRGRTAAKTGKVAMENTTSNVLMSLRKAANHPMLFRRMYNDRKIKQMAKDCLKEEEFADRNVDYIYEDMDLMTDFELHRFVQPYKILSKYGLKKQEWMNAGKVQKLQELLPTIRERGDRVLIFSQFVQVLDIISYVLKTMNLKFLTLTGQTNVNDRQALVDEFTEDESIDCFLLSTRAGGLGLNLMAANVVIILDMDFNPHNDKQAQDRAYRLGQKKEVTIYKLVTKGTIEEDMLALADTKLALDQQVSAESAVSGEMAAGLEIDEGEEGVVEKKIKASLMTTLQSRFEHDVAEQEYQATQAAGGGVENGDDDDDADEPEEEDGPPAAKKAKVPEKVIPARSRAAAAGRARRASPKKPTPEPEPEEDANEEAEHGQEEGKEAATGNGGEGEADQQGAEDDEDSPLSSPASSEHSDFDGRD